MCRAALSVVTVTGLGIAAIYRLYTARPKGDGKANAGRFGFDNRSYRLANFAIFARNKRPAALRVSGCGNAIWPRSLHCYWHELTNKLHNKALEWTGGKLAVALRGIVIGRRPLSLIVGRENHTA